MNDIDLYQDMLVISWFRMEILGKKLLLWGKHILLSKQDNKSLAEAAELAGVKNIT